MTIDEMKARHASLMETATELNHSVLSGPSWPLIIHWIHREIARYENEIARRLAVIAGTPKCANCGEPAVLHVGDDMICTKCGDILMVCFRSMKWKNEQLDNRAEEMKLKRDAQSRKD